MNKNDDLDNFNAIRALRNIVLFYAAVGLAYFLSTKFFNS